jgi:steroid delta-isomerase-like uncharacterized protein
MSSNNVKVVQAIYDYYARKDVEGAANLIDRDFEWTVAAFGTTARGQDGFKQVFGGFGIPFPDSVVQVKNAIDGGEWVVTQYNFVGTHQGPLLTPAGEVPATGRPVNIPGCEVWRVRNDKVVSLHTYFDAATMMQQLGLMPQPE